MLHIYISGKVSYHFVSREWRTFILAFRCIIWTPLANVNTLVKFLPRNSEVFKIFTKYLSFLVYNQVYNLFVWLYFCNETDTGHSEIPARSTWHVSRERAVLDSIAFMHLSMVCPRMGGPGNPREIWHFQVFKCQFPHPWVSIVSQIPTPGDHRPSQ